MLLACACKSSDSDETAEFADASLSDFGCEQECALQFLSPCTCGLSDPCGWQNDGICDRKCVFNGVVGVMFDDALDCPGPCEGACEAGFYTNCSCAADDPCGWAEDEDCDRECLDNHIVTAMFDDTVDCPNFPMDAGDTNMD